RRVPAEGGPSSDDPSRRYRPIGALRADRDASASYSSSSSGSSSNASSVVDSGGSTRSRSSISSSSSSSSRSSSSSISSRTRVPLVYGRRSVDLAAVGKLTFP